MSLYFEIVLSHNNTSRLASCKLEEQRDTLVNREMVRFMVRVKVGIRVRFMVRVKVKVRVRKISL